MICVLLSKSPVSISMIDFFLGIYNFLSRTFVVTFGLFLDYAS